ncbi:hypothetical protein DL89DRAFT_281144 [Linderina pennispora]|uniref:Uncharacterized protein n=1 Tax=Linderina pennispora TaxID=61395 RepID=A0A1Y1WMM9_9FUNG|nr:uncharacterized protein DL89DRAFT_281144 [Linderina pennispora]ORX74819.1 hypothetical protein DL89DRAFT_281144 [Linderina pennispora]
MDDSEYYSDILDEEDLDSEELEMLDEQNRADSSDSSGDEDENQIDASVLQSAIAMASMATGSTELANKLTVNWDTEAPNSDGRCKCARHHDGQHHKPGTYALEGGFLTDDEDSNYEEEDDDLLGDMDGFKDALRGMSGIGRQKRGRPSNRHRAKPEAQRLLGMANTLFVDRQLDAAYEVLCEAIRVDANAQEAWYTMALIRDEQGRPDDAVHLYTLAAHLQPSNHELWERLSAMHCEAAERKQALGQASDEDWQGGALLHQQRNPQWPPRPGAAQAKAGIAGAHSAARHAVQSRGDAAAALGWFTAAVSHYNELVRSYTKMQLTVSMEASGGLRLLGHQHDSRAVHYAARVSGRESLRIKLGARFIQGRGNETTWDSDDLDAEFYQPGGGHELPVELRAKLGQCRLLLGQTEQAHVHLQVVDQQDMGVYADVFLDIGRSMVDVGHAQEAAGSAGAPCVCCLQPTRSSCGSRWRVHEELGHVDKAFALLREVEEIQAEDARDQAQQQQQAEQRRSPGTGASRSPDSSTERHLALARKAGLWFAKLAELEPRLGDAAARAEYRQTAYLLYMDWKRVPFFYMADRSTSRSAATARRPSTQLENGQAVGDKASMAQRRMARIKKRLAKKTSEDDDLVPTSYLMQQLWRVARHIPAPTKAVRYIWGSRPAKAAVYRLASYAMCRSSSLSQLMSSPPMYKFMRRQLSLLADGVYGSSDTLPHALAHLPKRWCPRMPVAALQLGIAYLAFAIRSDMPNRHRVLMQGFTYLQRYAELRCKQAARNAQRPVPDDMVAIQEIAYNYARAFHSVGAEHLAIDFYERVFELPVALDSAATDDDFSDLRREAAYNLAELLEKHCTI